MDEKQKAEQAWKKYCNKRQEMMLSRSGDHIGYGIEGETFKAITDYKVSLRAKIEKEIQSIIVFDDYQSGLTTAYLHAIKLLDTCTPLTDKD